MRSVLFTPYLILIFIVFGIHKSVGQDYIDSLKLSAQKTSDSLLSIPLELIELDLSKNIYKPVDSGERIIKPYDFFGQQTLPNYGSPINSYREEFKLRNFFDNGLRYLDFFFRELEDFSFYRSNKTYVELLISEGAFFANSQSGLVDNLNASAFVSKNFANNLQLNVAYDRINQKGIYNNGRNLLGRLFAGIQGTSSTSRLKYAIQYSNQYFNIQHNGGIENDSLIPLDQYSIREVLEVKSRSAFSNWRYNQYGAWLSYRLKKDSSFVNPSISLAAGYKSFKYYMSDPEYRSPNDLYGSLVILDTLGILRSYEQYSVPVEAKVDLLESRQWSATVKYGLSTNHLINDTIYKYDLNVNQFIADVGWESNHHQIKFHWIQKYQQNGRAHHYGVQYKATSINWLSCVVDVGSTSDFPSWSDQSISVNKHRLWITRFDNPRKNYLNLNLVGKKRYLPEIYMEAAQLKNLIYLDSNAVINQYKETINQLNLICKESVSWKWLGVTQSLRWLRYSPDISSWNAWYSKSSIFANLSLAKKSINTKIELSANFLKPDNINRFNPLIGRFYPGSNNSEVLGPFIGAGLNINISNLNVLAQFDNIDSFWQKDRPQWVDGYPAYDFGFRIQLLWRFFN